MVTTKGFNCSNNKEIPTVTRNIPRHWIAVGLARNDASLYITYTCVGPRTVRKLRNLYFVGWIAFFIQSFFMKLFKFVSATFLLNIFRILENLHLSV